MAVAIKFRLGCNEIFHLIDTISAVKRPENNFPFA